MRIPPNQNAIGRETRAGCWAWPRQVSVEEVEETVMAQERVQEQAQEHGQEEVQERVQA